MAVKEPIVVLTVDQLRAIVAETVADTIAKVGPRADDHDVMSRRQVAKLVGVCPVTVSKLVKEEGLPLLRVLGKSWRFSRREVLAWMGRRNPE